MSNYDLYGIRGKSLDAARSDIEGALGLKLRAHESGYHCGDYYRSGNPGAEHFILQRNYDDVEGEWTEPAHREYELLLYVNETDRAEEIETALRDMAAKLRTERL